MPVFVAPGDATGLALVFRLAQVRPQPMKKLTESSRGTRQAVAKHLRLMAKAGLVRSKRRGRERVSHLESRELEAERDLRAISEQWDAVLGRLEAFVEK